MNMWINISPFFQSQQKIGLTSLMFFFFLFITIFSFIQKRFFITLTNKPLPTSVCFCFNSISYLHFYLCYLLINIFWCLTYVHVFRLAKISGRPVKSPEPSFFMQEGCLVLCYELLMVDGLNKPHYTCA